MASVVKRCLQPTVRARAEQDHEWSFPMPRTEGLGHLGSLSLSSQSSTGQEARAKQMSRSPLAITSLLGTLENIFQITLTNKYKRKTKLKFFVIDGMKC